jgi:hypothetical protein
MKKHSHFHADSTFSLSHINELKKNQACLFYMRVLQKKNEINLQTHSFNNTHTHTHPLTG